MALDSEPFDFFKHTEPNASKGKNTEIIVVESDEVAVIEEQSDDRSDQIEAAKKVCRSCAVIEPCLQWALETGQDSGVWGGLSEDERRALGHSAPAASINYF